MKMRLIQTAADKILLLQPDHLDESKLLESVFGELGGLVQGEVVRTQLVDSGGYGRWSVSVLLRPFHDDEPEDPEEMAMKMTEKEFTTRAPAELAKGPK